MNDREARIGVLLGVIPAVFYFGWLVSLSSNSLKLGAFLASLIACVAVVGIWSPYLKWTAGAVSKTSALTLLLFGQALLWHPLTATTGCTKEAYDNIQCTSQTGILLSFWCVGCVMTWWGSVLWRRKSRNRASDFSPRWQMTPRIARLSIGLALIPFLPAAFFLLGITYEARCGLSTETSLFMAYESCAILVIPIWILLWKSSTGWRPSTMGWTAIIGLPLLLTPAGVYWSSPDQVLDFLYKCSPILALGLWFGGTSIIWRQSTGCVLPGDEIQAAAPTCPACNYNLTGLREIRCPECGWSSTIEILFEYHLSAAID